MSRQGWYLIGISCLLALSNPALAQPAPAETKASADAALSKRIDELIARLGHKQFAERERAQKELAEMGEPALEPLRQATDSPDQEIATRAKACVAGIE